MAQEENTSQERVQKSTNIDVFDMPVNAVDDASFDDGGNDDKTDNSKGGDPVDLSSLPSGEVTARNGGWLPKEEYVEAGGDADDWVSAKVFNDRGDLFDTVKKTGKEVAYLKRQLTKRDKALRALGEHNQKLGEVEYQKALASLKKDKAEALRSGDYEAAVDIDDKILDVKKNEITADDAAAFEEDDEVVNTQPPPAAWTEYESNNGHWYGKNNIMTSAANSLVVQYLQENGIEGVPTEQEVNDAIAFMDEEIRDAFPHKFTEDNGEPNSKPTVKPRQRGNNSAVEAGRGSNNRTNNSAGNSKYGARDLNEEQLSIAKTFVATGAMDTIQAYVDQLAEVGGLDTQQ